MRAHCIRREKTNFLGAAHGLRGELMYYMEDGTRTESRSARAWLEKHPEIIKLFLPSQENQLNGSHETN